MGKRARVLIVDDDESILLSLEWLLETEGYDTTVAWSGEEALRLLANGEFDAVLVDADLHDVEAIEVGRCAIAAGARCALLEVDTRMQQIDSLCSLGAAGKAPIGETPPDPASPPSCSRGTDGPNFDA